MLSEIAGVVGPSMVLPGTSTPSNVFTSLQAVARNLVELAKESQMDSAQLVPPPYFVLQIGQFADEPGFSPNSQIKRAPVAFWAIDTAGNGATQITQSQIVQAVADHIDSRQFQTFTSVECAALNSSESDSFNDALPASSKADFVGASVSWLPGLLVNLG